MDAVPQNVSDRHDHYRVDGGSVCHQHICVPELFLSPLLTLLIQAGIMMYCGFAGNRLYYRHCVEGIRKLKTEYPIAAEYDKALQENGGVNVSLALCLLICYSIIIYLPNFFV